MLKITRIKDEKLAHKLFHIRTENNMDYCSCFLTLFGRTFHIKYSSKFNYFYIAQQVRRERLILDAVALSFIRHIIPIETKKTLNSLERISTAGWSSDYYMKGKLDGEDVFMKVMFSRVESDVKNQGVLQNEYEKSLLLSKECPYILKPLHYIQCLPCEILITPYIQNLRTLNSVLQSEDPAPVWMRDQLQEVARFLKSKNLVHRDINGGNICIGNIEGKKTQLFLNDLAYVTELDENGQPVRLNVEGHVNKFRQNWREEEAIFAQLLQLIDQKIAADQERERERERTSS